MKHFVFAAVLALCLLLCACGGKMSSDDIKPLEKSSGADGISDTAKPSEQTDTAPENNKNEKGEKTDEAVQTDKTDTESDENFEDTEPSETETDEKDSSVIVLPEIEI